MPKPHGKKPYGAAHAACRPRQRFETLWVDRFFALFALAVRAFANHADRVIDFAQEFFFRLHAHEGEILLRRVRRVFRTAQRRLRRLGGFSGFGHVFGQAFHRSSEMAAAFEENVEVLLLLFFCHDRCVSSISNRRSPLRPARDSHPRDD